MGRNKSSKRKPSQSPQTSPERKPQSKMEKTTGESQLIGDNYQLKFEAQQGDIEDQRFAHLSTEDSTLHLFISGKKFSKSVKESSQINLDNSGAIKIVKVINVTAVGTIGSDLDKNLIGIFSGAHTLDNIINAQLKEDKPASVLVHCKEGYERSVSTVLFYLLGYQNYSYKDAAKVLNEALQQGRGLSKQHVYTQAKNQGSPHNKKIAEIFGDIEENNMSQRMTNTFELARFFLSENKPPKTFEDAYTKKPTGSQKPIEIKIQVPTGLGRKSNVDALVKVSKGTSIKDALTTDKERKEGAQPRKYEDFKGYQEEQCQKEQKDTITEKTISSSSRSSEPISSAMLKADSSKGIEQQEKEEVATKEKDQELEAGELPTPSSLGAN